ncbi:uncharacterized protein DS421_10g290480 [Arachis hypogaea]|nr:uncharacterized protein DS421_10g290480 [Arachis hypogaea]
MPLPVLPLMVVQVLPENGVIIHSSSRQVPQPSPLNHSTHGSLVASLQFVPPLVVTFVRVVLPQRPSRIAFPAQRSCHRCSKLPEKSNFHGVLNPERQFE